MVPTKKKIKKYKIGQNWMLHIQMYFHCLEKEFENLPRNIHSTLERKIGNFCKSRRRRSGQVCQCSLLRERCSLLEEGQGLIYYYLCIVSGFDI